MGRDLDATTTRQQWRDIIARRTALLVQAASAVGDALRAGEPPEKILGLRRQAIEALIRLCEGTSQNIRSELDAAFRNEMDDIYLEAERWAR